jgi:hypothetical protein
MKPTAAGLSTDWLALREPADAAARSADLVDTLLAADRPDRWVVHDLGAGTGSMARWLAPLLPGPQTWVLRDRDGGLLAAALADPPLDCRGEPVSVRAEVGDLDELRPEDLREATLITASALLDLLRPEQLDHLIDVCAYGSAPLLITGTVAGSVDFTPADPLDRPLGRAFDDHQRRGRRLGPDAGGYAAQRLAAAGRAVRVRDAPWRLGPGRAELLEVWLQGWVHAAQEHHPALGAGVPGYLRRRVAQAGRGELHVRVGHVDLLALPASTAETGATP